MSAIFNGTSSFIAPTSQQSVVGSTPTYPVLMGGWVKRTNNTNQQAFISVNDNAASAVDTLLLYHTAGSDTLNARSQQGGNGSSGTLAGLTTGSWQFVAAYFAAANSRQAVLGTTFGTAQTTTRNTVGLNSTFIGKFVDIQTDYLNGRVAEMFVAQNFTAGNITTIVNALAGGARPVDVTELSSSLVLYQPLLAGVDETDFVGPAITATNVTWDSADHPIEYMTFLAAWARGSNVLIGT